MLSLRVTALLSVLGLVWRREGRGPGRGRVNLSCRSVLALVPSLVQLKGVEKVTKLESCIENGRKHEVLLDRR